MQAKRHGLARRVTELKLNHEVTGTRMDLSLTGPLWDLWTIGLQVITLLQQWYNGRTISYDPAVCSGSHCTESAAVAFIVSTHSLPT